MPNAITRLCSKDGNPRVKMADLARRQSGRSYDRSSVPVSHALFLDNIIEHAGRAKPGSGFAVSLNGKIEQAYS
jgi:hypothetical protein